MRRRHPNERASIDKQRAGTAFITRLATSSGGRSATPGAGGNRTSFRAYTFGGGLETRRRLAMCGCRRTRPSSVSPEVKLGIPRVIESALLPTLVGWGTRPAEIMYLGGNFTAGEAQPMGIVGSSGAGGENLTQRLTAWSASCLTSAPRAVRLQKKADPADGRICRSPRPSKQASSLRHAAYAARARSIHAGIYAARHGAKENAVAGSLRTIQHRSAILFLRAGGARKDVEVMRRENSRRSSRVWQPLGTSHTAAAGLPRRRADGSVGQPPEIPGNDEGEIGAAI
jgi:hypothetical protein